MEKTVNKFVLFFALLFFTAGMELRVAEGRGPIVSFKCNEAVECSEWCRAAECHVCTCLNHKCICRAADALHHIINPPSPTH
ncbi:unnamed protein product [Linum tenue]|uniref:Uncharacterized protein n=1 Tax=Linum tenue TaxID=586396 RepID=A0AAV0S617_9ROSI|nr:unnamed protein product [Linum tenue]